MEIYSGKKVNDEVFNAARAAKKTVIGTHSSTHHLDEVISCVLLQTAHENSIIVRHRDAEVLDLCDVVVDVGGVYDAEKKRFDHHQKTFAITWAAGRPIRLSSAGLVWKHYGQDILQKLLADKPGASCATLVDVLYDLIFEAVDAGDNGVRSCSCKPEEVEYIGGMPSLAALVGACNTSWLHWEDESKCFAKAAQVVKTHFMRILTQMASNWAAAADEIKTAPRLNLAGTSKSVLILREYYAFAKFIKYIIPDEVDVVGAIWEESPSNWCWIFRPLPWGQRLQRGAPEPAAPATDRTEVVACLTRKVLEMQA